MSEILIGRQEILDANLDIFAYEILYRGKDFDLNQLDQASNATLQVVTDTILEFGLSKIVGNNKAFINFTAQNLLEKTAQNLPKDFIVIEVLENVAVDLRIINILRDFSSQGYTIALDDFELTVEWEPLLQFADIIKLDIMAKPLEETLTVIEKLKPYGLTLLAEKVETFEQFEILKHAGCELFQGYFFSKPKNLEGTRLGVNQVSAIKLLTSINAETVCFDELETIISQDVALSYKLLKYINSAFFSLPSEIASIKSAIVYMGVDEVKRWVNILTLSSLSEKPSPLIQTILIRAKMCELLADTYKTDPGQMFLIGMLSSLDALLDIPLQEVLDQLSLAEPVRQAITTYADIQGQILKDVIDYQAWGFSGEIFPELKLSQITNCYIESINWTKNILEHLN